MELLTPNERQKLIDILCKLPGIEHLTVRHSLSATLPDSLRSNIEYTNILRADVETIVDMVTSEAWFQLSEPDKRYPLLVIIENAIHKVRGSRLEADLMILMNKLCIQLELSPPSISKNAPPTSALAPFIQELEVIINLASSLEYNLEDISDSFNQHIYRLDCKNEADRLVSVCSPILEFSAYLKHSSDLPTEVISLRIELMVALKAFDSQAKVTESSIKQFCRKYGANLEQSSEKRGEIQEQLRDLIQSYRLALAKSIALRNELNQ